jgi:nucleoside-diphosphate-sugar epimerase
VLLRRRRSRRAGCALRFRDGTVLLTGASGLVGRQLVRLLSESYRLVLTDCQSPQHLSDLPRDRVAFATFDLRDYAAIYTLFAKHRIDRVIHSAAISHPGPSFAQPVTTLQINFDATVTLLEAARLHGVARFVFISTIGVYGPFQSHRVNEKHPTVGDSPYGVAKLAAELMGLTYAEEFGLPFVALRYSLIYGPSRLQPCPIKMLVEAAAARRPLQLASEADTGLNILYEADAAGPILHCLEEDTLHRVYNIGDGKQHCLGEVLRILHRLTPSWSAAIGPGVLPRETTGLPLGRHTGAVIDISRARKDLRFSPSYDLERGVTEYFKSIEGSTVAR